MARVHDVTKNHIRRNGNLYKGIPGNPVRGATGHNRDEQMEVNNHDIGALTTFSKCRYK